MVRPTELQCPPVTENNSGLSSLSDDLPMEQAAVPVYTFINAPKSNFKGMAFYSRKSGGNAYDLSVVSASEAANNALAASKLKLIRVTGSGCSGLIDFLGFLFYNQTRNLPVRASVCKRRRTSYHCWSTPPRW